MSVNFVDEFIKVFLMTGTEVDEGLHGLVRICRDILALGMLEDSEHVVGKQGEVGDAIIDIGGFVHTDERFVEYGEEIAKELEGHGLKT